MPLPDSVEQYIDSLQSDALKTSSDDRLCRRVARIIAAGSFAPLVKFNIRLLFRELRSAGYIKPVKVRFQKIDGRYAFMKEDGEVFFNKTLLRTKNGCLIALVAVHEISHFLLMEREDYGKLAKLNADFIARYGKDLSRDLSPIEYYAAINSLSVLRGAEKFSPKYAEKTEKTVKEEMIRLDGAYKRLKESVGNE